MNPQRLCILMFLLTLAASTSGETVVAVNGEVYHGKVTVTAHTVICVSPTARGTLTLGVVKEILLSPRERIQFEMRRRKLRPLDAEGHYRLGMWLKTRHQHGEARICFSKAVTIDPGHVNARRERGFVKRDSAWTYDPALHHRMMYDWVGVKTVLFHLDLARKLKAAGLERPMAKELRRVLAFDLTKAAVEGRRQVQEAVRAMRTLIPGMENSYLIDTAPMIGVRETRRIFGEYVLTADDIKAMKIFDDTIGLGAAFIDIHNTEGPGMDKKSGYHLPKGGYYAIPYRTLVPESMNNLLVAGRCHSATHEAAGSTRWMAQCMVMGQAVGTAAAISVKENLPPRQVDVAMLQDTLRQSGTILK